jgi:hypothetical protein
MKNKPQILLVPVAILTMVCGCPNLDTEYFAKTKPNYSGKVMVFERMPVNSDIC